MKLKLLIIPAFLALLMSCQTSVQTADKAIASDFSGTFVSDGYSQRSQGYDWVAVSIQPLSDTTAHVAARSRVDLKKATCTFDSDARIDDNGKLIIPFEDKLFTFSLNGDSLQISGADEKSSNLLYYFCSGGATLEGSYVRIGEPVDEAQLDTDGFHRILTMQGITFNIREINRGFQSRLLIEPSGLELDNTPFDQRIYGWVSGAETEDLNSDGWPELLVYVCSSEGAVRTNVIGYSVNYGKSMSMVNLPDIAYNKESGEGFIGYDEFAVVETSLVQRFPLFRRTGSGYVSTGRTRQIQYKLKEGEAMRQFVPDKIIEY